MRAVYTAENRPIPLDTLLTARAKIFGQLRREMEVCVRVCGSNNVVIQAAKNSDQRDG